MRVPAFLLSLGMTFALSSLTAVETARAEEQPASSTRVAATPEERRTIAEFAHCLTEGSPTEAAQFVLKTGSWKERPLSSKKPRQRCVPAGETLRDLDVLQETHPDGFLFALADALMRRELSSFESAVIERAQPLPSGGLVDALWPSKACSSECGSTRSQEVQRTRERASYILGPQLYGECVVRTDPAGAHKLIMSEVDSANERAAVQALAPALAECVMQGSQLKASRSLLRGLLALSYYRIAHSPRADQYGAQK